MTLTDEQLDSAVKYNSAREYTRDQWVDIQMRISSDADGKPGRETAQAVANFQARNNDADGKPLAVDGKCGSGTLGAVSAIEAPWRDIVAVVTWCDLPAQWCVDRADRIAEELEELGVDVLLLQTNKSGDSTWKPLWTFEQICAFSQALLLRGVRTGLMPWAYPSRDWIEGFADWVSGAVASCAGGCWSIEHDIEGPWSPSRLEGYATTYDAADRLFEVTAIGAGYELEEALIEVDGEAREVQRVKGRSRCETRPKIGTTTFWDALSSSNSARRYAVKNIGWYCAGQTYPSTTNGSNGDYYAPKGPCRRAAGELPRFKEVTRTVFCGVASYAMSFDGRDPAESMLKHVEGALFAGFRVLSHWSLKHILSFWFSGDSSQQADQRAKHEYNGRYFRALKSKRSL